MRLLLTNSVSLTFSSTQSESKGSPLSRIPSMSCNPEYQLQNISKKFEKQKIGWSHLIASKFCTYSKNWNKSLKKKKNLLEKKSKCFIKTKKKNQQTGKIFLHKIRMERFFVFRVYFDNKVYHNYTFINSFGSPTFLHRWRPYLK